MILNETSDTDIKIAIANIRREPEEMKISLLFIIQLFRCLGIPNVKTGFICFLLVVAWNFLNKNMFIIFSFKVVFVKVHLASRQRIELKVEYWNFPWLLGCHEDQRRGSHVIITTRVTGSYPDPITFEVHHFPITPAKPQYRAASDPFAYRYSIEQQVWDEWLCRRQLKHAATETFFVWSFCLVFAYTRLVSLVVRGCFDPTQFDNDTLFIHVRERKTYLFIWCGPISFHCHIFHEGMDGKDEFVFERSFFIVRTPIFLHQVTLEKIRMTVYYCVTGGVCISFRLMLI